MAQQWPDHLVDVGDVFRVLVKELETQVSRSVRTVEERALDLEHMIHRAHHDGKIRRFVGRHPETGEVVGYSYKRDDIVRFVRSNPDPTL